MPRRIVIIRGHPDPRPERFANALVEAYASGAQAAGHEVRAVAVAELDFPVLRAREDWEGAVPPGIAAAQQTISWAEHLVIVYPLWLGSMPALLKAFLEQTFRPGFAVARTGAEASWKPVLAGRSARIVVTMGMPALVYRWYFRAHSLKSLERNILRFCGIGPISESLFGAVEGAGDAKRRKWLEAMRALGRAGR
jgi:putative NADPH-quinone reductase